ncbi:MAG: hypothetical protein GF383_15055 [Candidatus Lokiarchaeota archaeon]|nr:hypothetical protein [Candidatus Lokiarchaeota archaeon]MBD3342834.1 hypothetical protein [Candidatus Lokiarchaeota archaeon]
MNETEKEKDSNIETSENQDSETEEKKKPEKKTQAQILQEALGLDPEDIAEVEKKLFVARFFDYFSEETLDFIYKDRTIEQYKNEINKFLESLKEGKEEEKLLIRSFEDKQLFEKVHKIKKSAEAYALEKGGVKQPVDKKLKKLSLLITLPLFLVLLILTFLIPIWFLIPILCLFCMAPQLVRGRILRGWLKFKEEHKNDFYSQNREDILVLKDYTGELLQNIRSRLLEMKVPLQLIKFVLHSRDYDNLNLINQRVVRGSAQYFFTFEYPEGMEPFPIPEELLQQQQPVIKEAEGSGKAEKNFIVLTEMKGKDGILENFIPTLKLKMAEQINDMLNECEFSESTKEFDEIIPNYPQELVIYCLCGDVAEIDNVQVCSWKNQFKFYLFESTQCKCGEKIYVLSKMDESDEIPEELKVIFSS